MTTAHAGVVTLMKVSKMWFSPPDPMALGKTLGLGYLGPDNDITCVVYPLGGIILERILAGRTHAWWEICSVVVASMSVWYPDFVR